MSYHSKIYFDTKTDRKGSKSFGCNEFSKMEIFVGRSKNSKYRIANLQVTHLESTNSEDHKISTFEIKFNGETLNVVNYNQTEDLFSEDHSEIPNYEEKRKLNIIL